jgi:hypothetical protein
MGGIAKQNGMIPKFMGGVSDHVHLLVTLPRTFRGEIPLGLAMPGIPYPTGRFFRGTLSQALRARLRSVLSLRDTLADMCQATIGVVPTGQACRHVPGYDRCCPYGTRLLTCARLRSVLSLRDTLADMCQAMIGVVPTGQACRHFTTASN